MNITFLTVSIKMQGFYNIFGLEFVFQCQNVKRTFLYSSEPNLTFLNGNMYCQIAKSSPQQSN